MRTLKIIADPNGGPWRLCGGGVVGSPESVHGDLDSAVWAAEQALTRSPGGGFVEVHHADGRIERRNVPRPEVLLQPLPAGSLQDVFGRVRNVSQPEVPVEPPQPPQPAQAASQADSLRDEFGRVRKQKKYADWAVEQFLGLIWPALLMLFGSALSGAMADEVAAQRSVLGVFWATLAWSSGVALFVFILSRNFKAAPYQYAALATACLFAGSIIAVQIGHGEYGVPIEWGKYGSQPWAWPAPAIDAAINTFGWAGALIGGVCGAICGLWAARLWEKAAG